MRSHGLFFCFFFNALHQIRFNLAPFSRPQLTASVTSGYTFTSCSPGPTFSTMCFQFSVCLFFPLFLYSREFVRIRTTLDACQFIEDVFFWVFLTSYKLLLLFKQNTHKDSSGLILFWFFLYSCSVCAAGINTDDCFWNRLCARRNRESSAKRMIAAVFREAASELAEHKVDTPLLLSALHLAVQLRSQSPASMMSGPAPPTLPAGQLRVLHAPLILSWTWTF